jgi:hypothetical protein
MYLLVLLRLNSLPEVLKYPSSYVYPFKFPLTDVTIAKHLMSNFLFLNNAGFSIYFYKMNVLEPVDSCPIICLMSLSLVCTEIPVPLFVFSPGFTIHMFFWCLIFELASIFSLTSTKFLFCLSCILVNFSIS